MINFQIMKDVEYTAIDTLYDEEGRYILKDVFILIVIYIRSRVPVAARSKA